MEVNILMSGEKSPAKIDSDGFPFVKCTEVGFK